MKPDGNRRFAGQRFKADDICVKKIFDGVLRRAAFAASGIFVLRKFAIFLYFPIPPMRRMAFKSKGKEFAIHTIVRRDKTRPGKTPPGACETCAICEKSCGTACEIPLADVQYTS